MPIKIPTYEDFYNYNGLHCHRLWEELDDGWICPSCKRSKYQIMRWAKRNPKSPSAFYDWVACLHRHHDHAQGIMNTNKGRFSETIICDQCNSADGVAKRKLNLPKNFSFSPEEISFFVIAIPHGKHKVDTAIAKIIYDSISQN
ncbi:hypothetical protein [Sulfuricurvum sp.]|uniref:hypothetical protein n=1 Tax=Sulfuricurvum sp. TaxID=2025608 RepID=UPI00286E9D2D|nr:hypothetical protein [Sulfuricurvum sp.]